MSEILKAASGDILSQQPEVSGLRSMLNNANNLKIEPFPRRAPSKVFYIYNTSPVPFTRGLGSMGTFHIPACPEGAEYAPNPLKITDPYFEHYPAGHKQVNYREWNGIDVCKDILGVMPPAHADNDLTRMGVFISESNPPKKSEIAEAKEKLTVYFQELCLEGDLMAGGDDLARQSIRNSNKHKVAAKYIGYEADWCTLPRQRIPCPACGGMVVKGAAIHNDPACGAILDEAKARKFLPHLFVNESKEAPARKI
jgi:hypothetical protein